MRQNYHLFKNGRFERDQNTLRVVTEDDDGPHYLPVENVGALYCYGQLEFNTRALEFLSQQGIVMHVFNWQDYYAGTYMPRKSLVSGRSTVEQALHYAEANKRLPIARAFVTGGAREMISNVQYYARKEPELRSLVDTLEARITEIESADDIDTLRGIEGSIRSEYYTLFRDVTPDELAFSRREFRPPPNEVNSLISFGNSLLYSAILTELYSTHLDPTISYLHEPGDRRYSLCLDLSELFKPLIVDRLIFRLLNRKQLTAADFDSNMNGCLLSDSGRRTFVREFEEVLERTIKHPTLNRHVSYQYLLRLEAYKLHKHVLGDQEYEPFRRWW
ncbi:type I-B CRISPR-associated endonuclease Cas1b [Salinigranum halophilum]|uniref:type I-B CRISPR-associated endonuclease Cas1b n=1 Tax=Salinigranum halophilum TaxID=2565931 RepID=UPI0010A8CDA1|nr:type I-B CRISPR-associated endonuclease Cas1b [Salinigranum halophilum]